MAKTISQNNYYDYQNYSIDLDKMYKDFILDIDSIRSHIQIRDFSGFLSSLTSDNLNNAIDLNSAGFNLTADPQESRCHAFYRILGLPIVSDTNLSFYSPGFDLDGNSIKEKKNKKLNIIKSISKDLLKLMEERENYINNDVVPLFSTSNITSSVISLSLDNIRDFSKILANTEPFDPLISNQTRKIANKDIHGNLFNEYIGLNGELVDAGILSKNLSRKHIIKPTMVDPRIDLTVKPAKNMICVPFVSDKSKAKINDNVFLRRPLIEKICRDRFSINNQTTAIKDQSAKIKDYFNSVDPTVKDQDLVRAISSGNYYGIDEQTQFIKYLSILNSLIKILVKSQGFVSEAYSLYHWVPIPNKLGPEYGSTTKPIDPLNADGFNTPLDKEIVLSTARYQLQTAISGISEVNNKKNNGDFAFDGFNKTFDPDSSSSFSSNNVEYLTNIAGKRTKITSKANSALKDIEIILGEFSGLGLLDIIVIYASMYFIPKSSLIGLLDEDSYNRMLLDGSLKVEVSRNDIQTSIIDLNKTIKNFYDLVQSIYISVSLKTE